MQFQEKQALQILLSNHDFIRSVAYRCFPFPGMTDDIVQQVYVEILDSRKPLDFTSDIRPFLAKMTENIAHAQWRQAQKWMPDNLRKIAEHVRAVTQDLSHEEKEAEERHNEKLTALQECIEQLPEKSRELIRMHYFSDLKMRQIADLLGHKTNSVCHAIARLRKRLGDCIRKRLQTECSDVT